MPNELIDELRKLGVKTITADSRNMLPSSAFVALDQINYQQHIDQALSNGALAIVCDSSIILSADIKSYPVDNLKHVSADLFAQFYDHPSKKLTTIAVTGTNGKSSICFGIAKLANSIAQNKFAIIGTIGWGDIENLQPCKLTTPDNALMQQYLFELVNNSYSGVALEASSHALTQNRLQNIDIDIAIYTRITRDHLDYHKTMAQYAAAKARLLQNNPQYLIINASCPYTANLQARNTYTYSLHQSTLAHPAVYLQNMSAHESGFNADIITPWGEGKLNCPLLGEFNLENTLAMLTALALMQIPLQDILAAIADLSSAPGRLETFKSSAGKTIIVDYAHTPDALERALIALRKHFPGKKLHCIFGCGGQRDTGKRALMGEAAARHADYITLTNDNPRSEDPDLIINAIKEGIDGHKPTVIEQNRAIAIEQTICNAENSDIILVAGKGHETQQIIADKKIEFSDREFIKKLINHANT
jgi:UDP-N-acetylmuramoyl-L-alanyl-D-glutamate--2,6-diaminopimelate ligase